MEGQLMPEAEIVEVALPDGPVMLARVQHVDQHGPQDFGLVRRNEPLSFTNVTATLQAVGSAVLAALRHVQPEKASVKFGLEVAIKSGQLVDANTTATLKVTLEWQDASTAPASAS
jgi:hypothetical protein